VVLACAIGATISTALPSSRQATELDIARLMAISRNPQLDNAFEVYSERTVPVGDEISKAKVGYGWVEGLHRRALVLAPGAGGAYAVPNEQASLMSRRPRALDKGMVSGPGASVETLGYSAPYPGQAENFEMRPLIPPNGSMYGSGYTPR
jgi:hypothetical protein